MRKPVTPIDYKWTNEDIINISYTINYETIKCYNSE